MLPCGEEARPLHVNRGGRGEVVFGMLGRIAVFASSISHAARLAAICQWAFRLHAARSAARASSHFDFLMATRASS